MTAGDEQDFHDLMQGLGEMYGEPVSAMRIELYWRALEDLTLAEVRAAANAHARGSKFFPRPAELREAIDGSTDDRAELAFLSVLRIVRAFGYYDEPPADAWMDDATRRAAYDLYGGWQALCTRLPGEGPELLGTAKLFKGGYRAYHHREERAQLPPGETGRELTGAEASAALTTLHAELQKRGLPHGR